MTTIASPQPRLPPFVCNTLSTLNPYLKPLEPLRTVTTSWAIGLHQYVNQGLFRADTALFTAIMYGAGIPLLVQTVKETVSYLFQKGCPQSNTYP